MIEELLEKFKAMKGTLVHRCFENSKNSKIDYCITNRPSLNRDFLFCLALQKPIVSMTWLYECIQQASQISLSKKNFFKTFFIEKNPKYITLFITFW